MHVYKTYNNKTVKMPLFPRGKSATHLLHVLFLLGIVTIRLHIMRASGMFTYLAASRYAPATVAFGYMVTLAAPTIIAATDVTHST